jgi:excisionase family DNA binding protein
MDDLLTTAQVAELLGIPVRTLNRMAERGDLKPALTLAGDRGARLYRRADIEALAATQEAS